VLNKVLQRFSPIQKIPSYTGLAAIYDRMMDHVDYDEWTEHVVRLFEEYGAGGKRILEGGCGTGNVLLRLKKRGFRVAGFDSSFHMLRMAWERVNVPLWQCDLGRISVSSRWDGILCLYDTIQYFSLDGFRRVLSEIYRVLEMRGVFVFDLITESHAAKDWSDYTECDGGADFEYVRRTWYESRCCVLHTEFDICFSGNRKRYREYHRQHMYPLKDVERVIKESGFLVSARLDGFTMNRATEGSDRVHFVVRKEAA